MYFFRAAPFGYGAPKLKSRQKQVPRVLVFAHAVHAVYLKFTYPNSTKPEPERKFR